MARIKNRRNLSALMVVFFLFGFVVAQIVSNLLTADFSASSSTPMVTLAFETDPSGDVYYGADIEFNLLLTNNVDQELSNGEIHIDVTIPAPYTSADVEVWKTSGTPAEISLDASGHGVLSSQLSALGSNNVAFRVTILPGSSGYVAASSWQVHFTYYLP